MTDLENPFSAKSRSMPEITAEKNKQSRVLLLGICRTAKQTLLSLQRSVANSSMPALWQKKLDAARQEYLAFAQQIGINAEDAAAELARELGEPQKDSNSADDESAQP